MSYKENYVPVIKWKQGEQKAIECLSDESKSIITPLIEVAPIDWDFDKGQPKKTIDGHLQKIGESLRQCWNNDGEVYIDCLWIDQEERMADGNHYLSHILNSGREHSVKMVPVLGTDKDTEYQSAVVNAIQIDNLGVCFRLVGEDFENIGKNITDLLSIVQLEPEMIDLIIDYGYVNPAERTRTYQFLHLLLNSIPVVDRWRKVVLLGTSFPKDLSDVDADSVDTLERSEWLIWKRIISNRPIRLPVFGDYGISHPDILEADPKFLRISANIRYTADDKFIIFKGRWLRKFGYDQFYSLANLVVNHREYYGSNFSEGDKYISDVASGDDGPGNLTNWRKVGTNHHLAVVINELANLSLI
ncbi:beta family protein [Paenibacillus wynnii]|uniref:Beta protein n=1 Tax=Paenibacillus wynnii TaxID=268407 RepID=A0A098M690_9BACL|nr:beta family protein [Paenibacillus wynnii]KGE17553.1 hypothetical protein PWYN_23420 [Paenibacillus wynnii]